MSALIFDVDGTLADTETAHRDAFNAAFIDVGLDWYWSESLYAGLLDVAGGKERLLYYWKMIDPEEADGMKVGETIAEVHAIKTRHYEAIVSGGKLALRPGMLRLINEAHDAQMPMAIATTTTPVNVDALLRTTLGRDWRSLFVGVCDASVAIHKKPAPDVYLAALAALDFPASDCLAFEDSENGLRAACAAGIPTLVTPSAYTAGHQFNDALLVLPHLGDPDQLMHQHVPGADQRWVDLAALSRWHNGTLFESA
ncbi:HAD family hydrolase [Herbaspirillum sp. RTI4]|uniref:HAD family hydrolase n=1 Tax=Herbaspirillum sp. RTI4 TaxID=3048640 RepID=UPI002AB3EBA8|nr:HAD family hydrolase [Herbaspirillum sp. RTI4]MDY7577075.1 HAD family hydrolase [Herbaspirillum sp. RTI4]MEA9982255.1 HAD family hydrolase [Herbaspirillum sp. RTI4]